MGAGDPAPFESIVVVTAWCLAVALCIGAMTAPYWPLAWARVARRGGAAVAILVQIAFEIAAPSRSAIESAGRLVFLWPAAAIAIVAAGAWEWRDRQRMTEGDA